MSQSNCSTLAIFVAAHAVAETRLGPPYDRVGITDGAQWEEPERPLLTRTDDEASELLVRLGAGYAALRGRGVDEAEAASIAAHDLEGVADVLEARTGDRPSPEEAGRQAVDRAQPFLADEANQRAMVRVEREIRTLGWLDMHEVDILVSASDGEPDAEDELARYRAAFSGERIPWPDRT